MSREYRDYKFIDASNISKKSLYKNIIDDAEIDGITCNYYKHCSSCDATHKYSPRTVSDKQYEDVIFSDFSMKNYLFSKCSFNDVKFNKSSLYAVTFKGDNSSFEGGNTFENSTLERVAFSNVTFPNDEIFKNTILNHVHFKNVTFSNYDFSDAKLSESKTIFFDKVTFGRVLNFSGKDLDHVTFESYKLKPGSSFKNAKFTYTHRACRDDGWYAVDYSFYSVTAENVNFNNISAKVNPPWFSEQFKPDIFISFENAKLANSTFRCSNIPYAEFTGADLTNVNFAGADLRYACFNDALLANTNLVNTMLAGVKYDAGTLDDITEETFTIAEGKDVQKRAVKLFLMYFNVIKAGRSSCLFSAVEPGAGIGLMDGGNEDSAYYAKKAFAIKVYVNTHPASVAASAYNLMQRELYSVIEDKADIIKSLYVESFKHSGFFKCSNVTGRRITSSAKLKKELSKKNFGQIIDEADKKHKGRLWKVLKEFEKSPGEDIKLVN